MAGKASDQERSRRVIPPRRGFIRGTAVAVVAAVAAFVFPAGAAAGTLDQSQTTSNASLQFGDQRAAAQTFTAGRSGNLDQVDVHLRLEAPPGETCNPGSGVTVQIRTITGEVPSSTTLATANIPGPSVTTTFGFVSVAFAAPAAVTAGTQYALFLSAPDASCTGGFFAYSWGGASPGNPYPAGAWYLRLDPGSAWMVQGTADAAFKTYVLDPPPPPPSEPSPPSDPPPSEGTTPPPDDSASDTDPPETRIRKGAPNRTDASKVKFKFVSDEPGSTFQCKFDKKPWKACTSPKKIKRLDEGKHKFKVRAKDAAGNVDPTAARDRFKVVD